jgi:hypothetical protein
LWIKQTVVHVGSCLNDSSGAEGWFVEIAWLEGGMNCVKVRLKNDNGEIIELKVPADVVKAARVLPHAPERYFEIGNSVLLPLASLIQSRARPDGISNAVKLMSEAYDGRRTRRAPISVRRLDGGRYLVVDGNSTAVVAAAAGWPVIPGSVGEG